MIEYVKFNKELVNKQFYELDIYKDDKYTGILEVKYKDNIKVILRIKNGTVYSENKPALKVINTSNNIVLRESYFINGFENVIFLNKPHHIKRNENGKIIEKRTYYKLGSYYVENVIYVCNNFIKEHNYKLRTNNGFIENRIMIFKDRYLEKNQYEYNYNKLLKSLRYIKKLDNLLNLGITLHSKKLSESDFNNLNNLFNAKLLLYIL